MPMLNTSRLECSPLVDADWPFFLALQQDQQVMRFVAAHRPQEAIREAFEARLPVWSPGCEHWLCLVVRDCETQTPLGVTGYIHREPDCAEVGFLFAPHAQGKGFGLESLHAVCRYAFTAGGIRRLVATVTAGNSASKRLLEKVGFVQEGELREAFWLDGRWQNDWLFGLLHHEYRETR